MLNLDQIKDIIPHREPFLLIDEITELEPGRRVVAKKHLTGTEDWFRGHFPGQPVLPGVLTLEMLGQAGAVCVLSMPENKGKTGYFAKIDNAKFRRMIKPGDTVTLEVTMIKLRPSVGVGEAVASVNGEKAVSAEMTFALSKQSADEGGKNDV